MTTRMPCSRSSRKTSRTTLTWAASARSACWSFKHTATGEQLWQVHRGQGRKGPHRHDSVRDATLLAEAKLTDLPANSKAKRSVVHFFHHDFRRCKIMDKHLEKLAAKHIDTLFVKADVANVPFLVTKLGVKVLPCVIGFVDGVSKMKLVGFDELEGGDDFSTSTLEIGMVHCGVLNKNPGSTSASLSSIIRTSARQDGLSRRGIRGGATGADSDLDD
ncbi:SPOSA6832_00301, partial [Sporobolomyces salmonicolor]